MNLKEHLTDTLQKAWEASSENCFSWRDIIPLIDLTLLDENASVDNIQALVKKAALNQVAAICILPSHLHNIPSGIPIKRATVVNFPTGNESQEQVFNTIKLLVETKQIDELDYVFPYHIYLENQQHFALMCCQQNYALCQAYGVTFKVILETGAFPSLELIYQASLDIIHHGCDFLKTSTGKISIGATIPAAFAMLLAIKNSKRPCGIKLSGGIKTISQAFNYMYLAQYMTGQKIDRNWFRLGASSLLDDCLNSEHHA